MESFGINAVDEENKKSVYKGLKAVLFELGTVFIIVVNVIFVLNYLKIIDLSIWGR